MPTTVSMFLPTGRGKALVAIFVLAIVSRPFYSIAFHPQSTILSNHRHYHPVSTTLARHNGSCGKRQPFPDRLATKARTLETKRTVLHVSPEVLAGAASLVAGFAGWLYIDGTGDRNRRKLREEEAARVKAIQEERAKRAYIEPKEYWTEAELAPYDGSNDEDGPILLAADGLVFNVYKGRNFYLPGCEYHIFAGRDATRLLARNKVEEETEEEANKPLSIADRAFLATWIYTFKGKYDIVGKLEGFDRESTAM